MLRRVVCEAADRAREIVGFEVYSIPTIANRRASDCLGEVDRTVPPVESPMSWQVPVATSVAHIREEDGV